MKEIGKITALKDGIAIEDKSNVPSKGITAVPKGTEVPFDQRITVVSGPNQELYIHGSKTRNGITIWHRHDAKVQLVPSPLGLPSYNETVSHEFKFGHTPGDNSITFGHPEPGIEITYLGHPHREEVESLMIKQTADFDPHREAVFAETDRGQERVLFSGKVVPVQAHGFDFGTNNRDYGHNSHTLPDTLHPGELMFGASIGPGEGSDYEPNIKLFTAVLPEDGLLRVRSHLSSARLPKSALGSDHEKASRMIDEMAAISVWSRELDDPAFEDIRQSFPLHIVDHLGEELYHRSVSGFSDGSYDSLKKEHGIDWKAIRAGLPKDQVSDEAQRLANTLGIEYQEVRPPAKKQPRNRDSWHTGSFT